MKTLCLGLALLVGTWIALRPQTPAPPAEDYLVSPFNNRALRPRIHDDSFRFLVGGHLYGAPRNEASIFPAASLLANVERINDTNAAFFVGLGDIVMRARKDHLDALMRSFSLRIDMPFFNTVGNHDTEIRSVYTDRFGERTWFAFPFGHVLFVVLDTELEVGRIAGEQLEFLGRELQRARDDEALRTVVIFSHKLIWAPGREDFAIVYQRLNNRMGYAEDGSFEREVLPLLEAAARDVRITWISGDIGIDISLPLFHHRDEDSGLTWIATGIGDTKHDSLILFEAGPDGALEPLVLRLDQRPSPPLEAFGPDFWRESFRGR